MTTAPWRLFVTNGTTSRKILSLDIVTFIYHIHILCKSVQRNEYELRKRIFYLNPDTVTSQVILCKWLLFELAFFLNKNLTFTQHMTNGKFSSN